MLLPMLDDIGELSDEAKRLGLTMTADMGLRAENLDDAFTRLQRSIDMVVINIGSALEPIIRSTAETITKIGVKINEWLRENDKIVQSLYSFVPVLIAAGAALIAISNPLGVATAAVIAFGVKFGITMDDVKKATTTVTSVFGELIRYIQQTFEVMTEALMAGDYMAAAKAFWAGVQIVWIDGVEKVKQIMAEIAISFFDVISDMASGTSIFDNVINSMIKGLLSVQKAVSWITEGFIELAAWYAKLYGLSARILDPLNLTGIADLIKKTSDAAFKKADEIYKKRQEMTFEAIDTSASSGKLADRIRKAEEERSKAAAIGNAERKKELEEQLQVLRQQQRATESIAEVQRKSKGVVDTFDEMGKRQSETIGMFGGSVLDRLGLGTTIESNSERYLKETAEATKATADALGAYMAASATERFDSREIVKGKSATIKYNIFGTDSYHTAIQTMETAHAASSYPGLNLGVSGLNIANIQSDSEVRPIFVDTSNVDKCIWEGEIRYYLSPNRSFNSDTAAANWSFDIGTSTQKINTIKILRMFFRALHLILTGR